jgi:8-oxo-dGTP diphosphatase
MSIPIQDAIRFCFRCGAMLPRPVPTKCTACGLGHYANPKLCVGVLVVHEGSVILTRRAIEPYYGYWDIPGGFCEVGEHPATSAVRELKEELGCEVQLSGCLGCWTDKYEDPTGLVNYSTVNIFYLATLLREAVSHTDDEVAERRFFPILSLPDKIAFPDHASSVLSALQDAYKQKGVHYL